MPITRNRPSTVLPPDGYALRAADIAGSAPDTPAVLAVVDTLYAGDVASIPALQGQAVRLMTGSMIPPVRRLRHPSGGHRRGRTRCANISNSLCR